MGTKHLSQLGGNYGQYLSNVAKPVVFKKMCDFFRLVEQIEGINKTL